MKTFDSCLKGQSCHNYVLLKTGCNVESPMYLYEKNLWAPWSLPIHSNKNESSLWSLIIFLPNDHTSYACDTIVEIVKQDINHYTLTKNPSSFLFCSLASIMTLLIQILNIVLKMYALSIWSQNKLPIEIIGSLRDVDENSVSNLSDLSSKHGPDWF